MKNGCMKEGRKGNRREGGWVGRENGRGGGSGGKGMVVVCERGRGDIRTAGDDGGAVSGCEWKEGRRWQFWVVVTEEIDVPPGCWTLG